MKWMKEALQYLDTIRIPDLDIDCCLDSRSNGSATTHQEVPT